MPSLRTDKVIYDEDPTAGYRFLETYSDAGGGAVRRYEERLLGTRNAILLVDDTGTSDARGPGDARGTSESAETLDRAAAAAFELMIGLEERLSKFQPDSEVGHLNALAADEPVSVSDVLFELLLESKRYWELSGGAFDPAVGALMRAWGFDDHNGRVPPEAEIRDLLRVSGMDKVQLDVETQSVRFSRPGVSVDLGAIGKGYIVDRAVDRLKELGVRSGALVSGRSTIVVWGRPPGEERWQLGIVNPRDPDEVLLEVAVSEGAVSTSAAYERKFTSDGTEYGHVLDPRTGRPVKNCLGVTAWSPRATPGDVVSTTLFVLGADRGAELLAGFSPCTVTVVEEDSSSWGGLKWRTFSEGEPGLEVLGEHR